jgi:hypothetical protein
VTHARATFALLLLEATLLEATLGCRDAKGVRFDCHCSFVTDTDVPGTVDVSVCAKDPAEASERGGDCATSLGVGLGQGCACRTDAQPCPQQACQQTAALAD